VAVGIITCLWVFFLFSLCFGDSLGGFVGNPATFFLYRNVGGRPVDAFAAGVPFMIFSLFQLKVRPPDGASYMGVPPDSLTVARAKGPIGEAFSSWGKMLSRTVIHRICMAVCDHHTRAGGGELLREDQLLRPCPGKHSIGLLRCAMFQCF
jgi:hypothetical protein